MDLKEMLHSRCQEMEIPMVGITDSGRWNTPLFQPWVPEEFRPEHIFPEAKTVIVIGLPILLPVLETAPSIWYHEHYKVVNQLLDQHTYRLATWLNSLGYPSVFIPRDGYGSINVLLKNPVAFFSHRHAAVLTGLGTFGVNNMVLTPEYGPRVRFGTVFTSAEIAPDPIISDTLCTKCNLCVDLCPQHALDGNDYPEGLTNKHACASRSADLVKRHISPCGICIKVCPIGKDRAFYKRKNLAVYHNDAEGNSPPGWKHVRELGGG